MDERHLSRLVSDQGAHRARCAGAPRPARLRPGGRGKFGAPDLRPGAARGRGGLAACGFIVVTPPWTLAGELATMLPELAAVLSGASGGAHRLDWLAGES